MAINPASGSRDTSTSPTLQNTAAGAAPPPRTPPDQATRADVTAPPAGPSPLDLQAPPQPPERRANASLSNASIEALKGTQAGTPAATGPSAGATPSPPQAGKAAAVGRVDTASASNAFRTPREAALAALRHYNPWSIKYNREVAGLIYQRKDGSYGFTGVNPKPFGEHNAVVPLHDPEVLKQLPPGAKIVGDFHTHGAAWSSKPGIKTADEKFSTIDLDNARAAAGQSKRPTDGRPKHPNWVSYLATPQGRFLEYTPAQNRPPVALGTLSQPGFTQ